MRPILLTTALVAALFVAAVPAFADCDQVGSFPAGTTVTCDAATIFDGPDAVETRGIEDGSANITVNVLDGATLDTSAGAEQSIDLDDDDTTISVGVNAIVRSGSANRTINGGNGLTVVNKGLIESLENEAIQGSDDVDVENAGTIRSVGKGIDANGDAFRLVNQAGAQIESTAGEGVEADGNASKIENRGTIRGFDDAVQVGENALIDNYGIIENTQTLAEVEPAVPGVEAQDAIDIDSGTINNHAGATIRSTTNSAIDFDPGAADSFINNWGDISGTLAVGVDDQDMAGQQVTNYGRLVGTSGTALNLGLGDDSLTMMTGGMVEGGADFGAGKDALIFDAAFSFDTGSLFAGGALFDGGEDFDTLTFGNKTLTDIRKILGDSGHLEFAFVGGGGLRVKSWESFVFADGSTLARSDLDISAVPLPAGVLLLGSGLAGFALVSHRRRKRAAA